VLGSIYYMSIYTNTYPQLVITVFCWFLVWLIFCYIKQAYYKDIESRYLSLVIRNISLFFVIYLVQFYWNFEKQDSKFIYIFEKIF